MKRECQGKKTACSAILLKLVTIYSTFLGSGWSTVRIASLAKGGTLKKRPLQHLHKVLTQSNKVSPQIFQKALI
jgi:hypothetical protein